MVCAGVIAQCTTQRSSGLGKQQMAQLQLRFKTLSPTHCKQIHSHFLKTTVNFMWNKFIHIFLKQQPFLCGIMKIPIESSIFKQACELIHDRILVISVIQYQISSTQQNFQTPTFNEIGTGQSTLTFTRTNKLTVENSGQNFTNTRIIGTDA